MIKSEATVGIVLSRFDSTRLPGKAMEEIGGVPLLEHVMRHMKQSQFVDEVILATTTEASDDALSSLARHSMVKVCRGSADDVLGRVVQAVENTPCDTVVVAYGDNPLLDPEIVDLLVSFLHRENLDYAWMPGLPLGADVGVFSRSALEWASCEASQDDEREHLNAYITRHPELFRFGKISAPTHLQYAQLRLTVDTDTDLQLMRDVEKELSRRNAPLNLRETILLAKDMPEMFVVNAEIQQRYATADWERMRKGLTVS